MFKYILLFCLIATSVFAQDNTQQKIETTIGKLMLENIVLTTKIENLSKEITDLKKQSEMKDDKK